MGASIAGLMVSNARGSLFGIGFNFTKKAFIVLVVIAFIGSWLMVSGNSDHYKDRFSSAITGLSISSADDIGDDAIKQLMIVESKPKRAIGFSPPKEKK